MLTHFSTQRNGNISTSSADDGREVLIHFLRLALVLSINSIILPDRRLLRPISSCKSLTYLSYSSSSNSSGLSSSLRVLAVEESSSSLRLFPGFLAFLNFCIILFLQVVYISVCVRGGEYTVDSRFSEPHLSEPLIIHYQIIAFLVCIK